MTIRDKEIEIIDDFALFDDAMDRYEHLIDYGKQMPQLAAEYCRDEFLVKGCQSKVWLVGRFDNGLMRFEADSNTVIVRGIVGLLLHLVNGEQAESILAYDFGIIQKIGLQEMLSSQRSNGLLAMMNRIKEITRMVSKTTTHDA